jgi:Tol biopolymer transport system component
MLTSPGTAVGTIAYMSPEQARGEELDGRSDVFSLGAVLYQMIAGKQPFGGSTSAVTFDNILHNDPPKANFVNPQVTEGFQRILDKALEKDRDFRYQVAAELRADLKRLQRTTDSGRTPTASGSGPQQAALLGSADPATPSSAAVAARGQTRVPQPGSSALLAAAKQNKVGTGLTVAIAAVVLAAAGFGVYSIVERNQRNPFEHYTIENLTNNGDVSLATLSPDGKYLLHVRDNEGLQSLWLRHIPTGSNTQIVPPAPARYLGLTFSPDGSYIYCLRRDEKEQTLNSLYTAPVLGGTPRLLIADVDSPITFSPDGQRFAYLRQEHSTAFFDLLIAHADGTPDRDLFKHQELKSNSYAPIWSPDGKTIVISVFEPVKGQVSGFLAADVATGKQRIVSTSADRIYDYPAWWPGGEKLIVTFESSQNLFPQLGIIDYPDGKFRRLTTDTNAYSHPSISAGGRMIAVSQVQTHYQLSMAAVSAPDKLVPIPLSSHNLIWQWDWLPDGRLVIPQDPNILAVGPTGGESVLLRSDPKNVVDQVASCGKYIVFRSLRLGGSGSFNLFRMDANGGNVKQLTSSLDADPHCAADGGWVYFEDDADKRDVKRIPIEGGTAELMLNSPGLWSLSADGRYLLTVDIREADHSLIVKIIGTDDKKIREIPVDRRTAPWGVRFSPDGKALVYTVRENGVDNLWIQPLDGGKYRQMTHYTTERILQYAFSRDGSKIALERGHTNSDAVLLRDSSQ